MRFGHLELIPLLDGFFRLDGGAMFGVVPKPLWEKRALGITLCAGAMGHWNIDESRHARECLHPADYYGSSYYEIWTKALETLLKRHGFVMLPRNPSSFTPLPDGPPSSGSGGAGRFRGGRAPETSRFEAVRLTRRTVCVAGSQALAFGLLDPCRHR